MKEKTLPAWSWGVTGTLEGSLRCKPSRRPQTSAPTRHVDRRTGCGLFELPQPAFSTSLNADAESGGGDRGGGGRAGRPFSCRDATEKADERQKPANAVNEEAQVVREILKHPIPRGPSAQHKRTPSLRLDRPYGLLDSPVEDLESQLRDHMLRRMNTRRRTEPRVAGNYM